MITIKATEEVTYRCEIMDEMEEEILDYIRENQDSMTDLTDEEKIFMAIEKLHLDIFEVSQAIDYGKTIMEWDDDYRTPEEIVSGAMEEPEIEKE